MITADEITRLRITFSRGSFAEWSEMAGDTYPQAFIDEWEENYNRLLIQRLSEAFPNADITVEEGYNQTDHTEIYFEPYDYEDEEKWDQEIEYLLDIGSDGEALEQIWSDPSPEAIAQAIDDTTDKRPIFHLQYNGANYAFAKHDGAIWWLDLDIDQILDDNASWHIGTLENAALAFREEFDSEFELITQAEAAAIVGITTQAINQATRDGRLRTYKNLYAPVRQGRTLVNKSDIKKIWPH